MKKSLKAFNILFFISIACAWILYFVHFKILKKKRDIHTLFTTENSANG